MFFHLHGTKQDLLKHFAKINSWLPKLLALLWKHPCGCPEAVSPPAYTEARGLNLLWCLMCPGVANTARGLARVCAGLAGQTPQGDQHRDKPRAGCAGRRCPEEGWSASVQRAGTLPGTGLWPTRAGGASRPRLGEFYPSVAPALAVRCRFRTGLNKAV